MRWKSIYKNDCTRSSSLQVCAITKVFWKLREFLIIKVHLMENKKKSWNCWIFELIFGETTECLVMGLRIACYLWVNFLVTQRPFTKWPSRLCRCSSAAWSLTKIELSQRRGRVTRHCSLSRDGSFAAHNWNNDLLNRSNLKFLALIELNLCSSQELSTSLKPSNLISKIQHKIPSKTCSTLISWNLKHSETFFLRFSVSKKTNSSLNNILLFHHLIVQHQQWMP